MNEEDEHFVDNLLEGLDQFSIKLQKLVDIPYLNQRAQIRMTSLFNGWVKREWFPHPQKEKKMYLKRNPTEELLLHLILRK